MQLQRRVGCDDVVVNDRRGAFLQEVHGDRRRRVGRVADRDVLVEEAARRAF